MLKNRKAAGPDKIQDEALKADVETATNILHCLFSKIWEGEEVPAEWKEGNVIKLGKMGDLSNCNNYRGIMLLSVPGKVLNPTRDNERSSRLRAQRSTSRLLQEQVLCRSDLKLVHHSGAIARVEFFPLRELH